MTYTLPNPPHAIDKDAEQPEAGPFYPGAAFRGNVGGLVQSTDDGPGVARAGALDPAALRPTLAADGTVKVDAGPYVVASGGTPYLCHVSDTVDVDMLAPADSTNPRIDRVVLRVDDPDNGGTSDRSGSVEIIRGTPAASPKSPGVTGTSQWADIATVAVPRNGAGVPMLTDVRTFTAATGGVVYFPTATLLQAWKPRAGAVAYAADTKGLYVRAGSAWQQYQEAHNTDTVSSGIVTAASGWKIDHLMTRRNGIVSGHINAERTGADIKAGATGNIGNTLVCTISKDEWRPVFTSSASTAASGGLAAIEIQSGGNMNLTAIVANGSVPKGSTQSFAFTYVAKGN